MKSILVVSLILISLISFSLGKVVMSPKGRREIRPEAVALQIEYLGSCSDFALLAPEISVSSFVDGNCLPIALNAESSDLNDLK